MFGMESLSRGLTILSSTQHLWQANKSLYSESHSDEGHVLEISACLGRRVIVAEEHCAQKGLTASAFPANPGREIPYSGLLTSRWPRCFSKKLTITL